MEENHKPVVTLDWLAVVERPGGHKGAGCRRKGLVGSHLEYKKTLPLPGKHLRNAGFLRLRTVEDYAVFASRGIAQLKGKELPRHIGEPLRVGFKGEALAAARRIEERSRPMGRTEDAYHDVATRNQAELTLALFALLQDDKGALKGCVRVAQNLRRTSVLYAGCRGDKPPAGVAVADVDRILQANIPVSHHEATAQRTDDVRGAFPLPDNAAVGVSRTPALVKRRR